MYKIVNNSLDLDSSIVNQIDRFIDTLRDITLDFICKINKSKYISNDIKLGDIQILSTVYVSHSIVSIDLGFVCSTGVYVNDNGDICCFRQMIDASSDNNNIANILESYLKGVKKAVNIFLLLTSIIKCHSNKPDIKAIYGIPSENYSKPVKIAFSYYDYEQKESGIYKRMGDTGKDYVVLSTDIDLITIKRFIESWYMETEQLVRLYNNSQGRLRALLKHTYKFVSVYFSNFNVVGIGGIWFENSPVVLDKLDYYSISTGFNIDSIKHLNRNSPEFLKARVKLSILGNEHYVSL